MEESKKKKIAVIGLKGLPAFGGAANVGENIIEQLKDEYDFTVLSISSHTHLKTGEYNGYKQVVFKSFLGKGGLNTIYYYFVSLLYVLFHKFDIVHLHHLATGVIIPFINLRSKTVVTAHNFNNPKDPKFTSILFNVGTISKKIAIRSSHRVTCVSLYDRKVMNAKFNKEIIYIPNGINLKTIIHVKKTDESYLLFSAGRIFHVKGLHFLIEAANSLNIQKNIKIVGDIDRVPSYKQKIMKGIEGLDVDILGLIKEKIELMKIVNNAELFIFPSLYEAMSMMLLEVASMKTPIIASDIPANKNVFSSDEVLFFKSGDSADLAEKIKYALANVDEMAEKAEKAYKKLINNYTWEEIAKQYKIIYDQF